MSKIQAVPSPDDPDSEPIDPFDVAAHLVDATTVDVQQVYLTVDVRKPKRDEFFRVHHDPRYTNDVTILERDTGMERESYLVAPSVRHLVADELKQVRLFTAVNKFHVVYLWPVRLPAEHDERLRKMANAQLETAEQAKSLWVKMRWNRNLGAHEMFTAKGDLGEPQWPGKTFDELFRLGFKDNLIDSPQHPVIRELHGEI